MARRTVKKGGGRNSAKKAGSKCSGSYHLSDKASHTFTVERVAKGRVTPDPPPKRKPKG